MFYSVPSEVEWFEWFSNEFTLPSVYDVSWEKESMPFDLCPGELWSVTSLALREGRRPSGHHAGVCTPYNERINDGWPMSHSWLVSRSQELSSNSNRCQIIWIGFGRYTETGLVSGLVICMSLDTQCQGPAHLTLCMSGMYLIQFQNQKSNNSTYIK